MAKIPFWTKKGFGLKKVSDKIFMQIYTLWRLKIPVVSLSSGCSVFQI